MTASVCVGLFGIGLDACWPRLRAARRSCALQAMKLLDLLGAGGSLSEFYLTEVIPIC